MTSKKLLIVLLLVSVVQLYAQDKTIEFSYDNAGNQTERKICVNCSTTAASKTLTETTAEDFIPLDTNPTDQISYYPNPVQQELYLKWELINDKKVTAIMVFTNTSAVQLHTVNFSNLPLGVYLIMMQYSDGKDKTFKIIKE